MSDRLAVVLWWFIELYSWSRFFAPTNGLTKVIQEVLADLKRDENVCLIVHLQMRVLVFQAGRLLEPGETIIVLKITKCQSANIPTVPTFHLSLFIWIPPGPSRDPRISLSNCPNRDRQNLKRFDMINWMTWLARPAKWWHDVAFIMIEFSTCDDESDTSVSDNER